MTYMKENIGLSIALVLMLLVALQFSGCAATDKVYNAGKTIYIGGKEVVIQNADKLSPETLNKLERLDDYAGRYDNARTVVREGKPQTATGE